MKKSGFLILILLLGCTVAVYAGGSQETKKKDNTMMTSDNSTMKKDDTMMKSDDSMMKKDGGMMMNTNADLQMASDPMDSTAYNVKGLGTQVVAFSNEQSAMMMARSQTVVYFFAATWCPDCMATYKDIKTNYSKIPSNVLIVFVDYDKAGDLKKKYGITSQHTFVVVGPSGEKKKIWAGTRTVDEIIGNATTM